MLGVAVLAGVVALAGCGSRAPNPAGLRLERADLVYLARTLQQLQPPVRSEVAAARASWTQLSRGLPPTVPPPLTRGIAAADARAGGLALPARVATEHDLSGPAAAIGGLLRSYVLLTQRGWRFLAAATARTPTGAGPTASPATGTGPHANRAAGGGSHASPAAAGSARGFLRANSPLYIYCVYDGHYSLSLIGAKLSSAYRALGGGAGFGAALTPSEVGALGRAYSIAATRLQPHPPASLKL